AVPPPDPLSHDVDHFKCYQVKLSRGTKFQVIPGVAVLDQFNQPRLFDIDKPTRLCLPVDKNGEGIKHQSAHLMCYQVKAVKEPPQPKHVKVLGIFVNNQFGPERLDTVKEDEFCVPSTRVVPNRSPVARDDTATTTRGLAVIVDVLGNDSDPDGDTLTVSTVGSAANGTTEIVTGGVKYTPTAGFTGQDQFTYTISDGRGGTASASVRVEVTLP